MEVTYSLAPPDPIGDQWAPPEMVSADAAVSMWLHRMAVAASLFTLGVGLLTLGGYVLRLRSLVALPPGSAPMMPITAMMFVLVGAGLWLVSPLNPGVFRRRSGQGLALLAVLFAAMALLEYAVDRSFGFDLLLFADRIREWSSTGHAGQPSPHAAVAFVVTGSAVMLLDCDAVRGYRYARVLVPMAALVAGVGLAGRLYGVDYLLGSSRVTGMAWSSAGTFVVVTGGLLACRPDRPPVLAFVSRGLGGVTVRRLSPAVVVALLLAGGMLASVDTSTSALAVTAASVILLLTLLLVLSRVGNALDRVDHDHQVALATLHDEHRFTEAMLQSLPDGLIVLDPDGVVQQVSAKWCEITGFEASDALGLTPPYPWWPPDQMAERTEMVAAIRASVDATEVYSQIRRADGTEVEVLGNAHPVLTADGAVRLVVGTLRDLTERNRAEAEQRRLADQLTYFFDLSTDLLCIAGADGYFKRINPAWERTLGFTEAELTARPYLDFVHPDDIERTAAEAMAQATAGKVSLSFDNRYRCRDGSYLWLSWNAFPHGDWVYAVARDMTEQRRAAEEQARLAAIVDSSDDAIISKTLDGTITSWNRAAEEIYGFRADEAIGRSISIILESEYDEILDRVAAGESVTNQVARRRHKDGSTVYVGLTVSPIRDSDGIVVAAAAIGRDVTSRRMAEERFRRLVQSAPDAMIIVDDNGTITLVNEQVERLFGYPAADLIGRSVDMLVPERARALHSHHRQGFRHHPGMRQTGGGTQLHGLRRDGTEFPIDIRLGPMDSDDGALVSVSIRDASERQQIEGDLAAARDAATAATAAKSAFLATMSHEIRTPMNAVIGMTGLLLDTELDGEQRDFAQTIRDSGETLLSLLNNILDFSKIESGELELEVHPFDLRDCVDTALSLVALAARAKGLELVAQLEEDCPELVVGDLTRFRQVIVNLLTNAVKFTPSGEIVVTIGAHPEQPTIGPGAAVRLIVTVRDTGIGIPPERMHRLFQSFGQVDSSTTRLYGGSGLGLVISRRLAQAMGGDLQVTSQAGVGSTFTFTADLVAESDRRVGTPDPGTQSLIGKSVLIVDDNPTNRKMLQLLLPKWGMIAIPAASGFEALELLSAGAEQPIRCDAAILDMHMPAMDGIQLAAALRLLPAGRDLPLILLGSLQGYPISQQRAQFAAILTKPIRTATLLRNLVQAVVPAEGLVHAIETAGGRRAGDGPRRSVESLRILVAEDNLVNQKVAQAMLTKLGHRVDTVGDGLEAVQAVRTIHYDVVLMDMQMPHLDGPGATKLIRAGSLPAGQPYIVALTANVLVEDREICLNAGMDAFLAKPFRRQELCDVLAQMGPGDAASTTAVHDPDSGRR